MNPTVLLSTWKYTRQEEKLSAKNIKREEKLISSLALIFRITTAVGLLSNHTITKVAHCFPHLIIQARQKSDTRMSPYCTIVHGSLDAAELIKRAHN